ncbi:UDP-N-acetylmuramate dehydrogenase [Cognatilysobacter bugurensis]|uniref:UDP-N-acetylenolpyruvoylglucosamine reductase n=1 Tax=Cognatilysobacter bugurensis TaxID=543356 RepID=A0A918W595_9GAMM|nr:UDP-N-acetylmuramate dehydrogenase [Lysobacter bugurensis]GHA70131.1 UDP-N-acetylenolpyruvoylglucosamine reductase [Lysobacter bugurensis]
MTDAVSLTRDADLTGRNTFGVAARAPWLVEVADAARLPEVFALPQLQGARPLVLGGGSNLLFAGDAPGPVLALTGRGVSIVSDDGERAIVRADAGVEWHALVMDTLGRGFAGLENLALIPGTTGAAPIQNIGAYGVEVGELIHAVEAFEPGTGTMHRLDRDACAFGYRDSVFKHAPDRFVVTAVEFDLLRTPSLTLDYAGLREALATRGIESPTARDVADAVIDIRRSKLPDPAVLGNAGSFFKNPIVPVEQAEALLAEHPTLPVFRAGSPELRKLSAAWLIDRAGWKGQRDGDAGVAPSHALVLVNYGSASGRDLLDLARRIADSVHARFGVRLEPEPRVIGAAW